MALVTVSLSLIMFFALLLIIYYVFLILKILLLTRSIFVRLWSLFCLHRQRKEFKMKGRRRVNPRKDQKIFRRTAMRVHKLNLPGYSNRRGGTCL